MRSILLFITTIALVTALSGCEKKCPKPIYPRLEAIEKIPYYDFYVIGGRFDHNSTKKAFKTIKALRVSEHYYFTLISDYRKEFNK